MFRHKGNTRTFAHNLKLASSLSFVAGIVNITGVFAFATLTTNVTGHFAFFADELVKKDGAEAFVFINFILCFLLGAFVSSFLSEVSIKKSPKTSHILPLILETIVLIIVSFSEDLFKNSINTFHFASYALLFAMGLQNALVTKVSQSVVRTTHLTGLFTDLGIELSQLFFYRKEEEKSRLSKSIYLKLSIIAFFFLGCVIGGFVFQIIKLKTLLIASSILALTMYMDYFTVHFFSIKRRIRQKH
ncbi:YoaK family protein [Flavobacterium sp.]|uniref:YoaK family protein n=1 Tax=Flavobacterium sp. TaxID=239 RepID=UPI0035B4018B